MNANFVAAASIQVEVSLLLNDVAKSRWTQAMLDAAYNYAIGEWNQRLSIPVIIDSTAGWGTSSWSSALTHYALPLGIDSHMVVPQYKRSPFTGSGVPTPGNALDDWQPFHMYTIEPPSASSGQWEIRFPVTPYDAPARLIAFIPNTRIPTAAHTLAVQLPGAAGTNATLNAAWTGGKSGFVAIDREVIAFVGVQNTALLNLVRNIDGDGIAVHNVSSAVGVMAAFEEHQDRSGFIDSMIAACHRMYLNNASSSDLNFHQQMVTYYDNKVKDFWRRRVPNRKTRFLLSNFSYWN